MRPLRTRLAAVAAVLLVGGPLAVLAAGADAPSPTRCGDPEAVTRLGDWEAVRGPAFTTRPGGRGQDLTTYAVHPAQPEVRFATNGTSVERSDDGGCSWQEVWALPDVPTEEDTLAVATAEVVELVVPTDPRGDDRLVLVVRDGNGGPRVLISADGGREEPFRDRSEGLPPTGVPRDLLVAATNPDFLFLAVRTTGAGRSPAPAPGTPVPVPVPVPAVPDLPELPGLPGGAAAPTTSPGALWGSVDGGLTWEPRVDLEDLGGSSRGIDLLAGHPTSPNRIWAVGDGLLRASTDGGRTFDGPAPSLEEQRQRGWRITALVADRLHGHGTPDALVLLGFSASSAQGPPVVLSSADEGATFDESPAPGVVDAAAPFLPGSGSVVLSTVAGDGRPADIHLASLRRGVVPNLLRSIGPPVDGDDLQVSADLSSTPTFHARTASGLLRYVGPAAAVPPALPLPVGGVVSDALPPLSEAALTPTADAVTLTVGEQVTVEHSLVPPRRAAPLDLYLLVDTSESMADDLDRVVEDLLAMVGRLRADGVDVSVGLGEFKGGESSVAYRRVTGIGPSDADLRGGLQELVADGYGEEAQLIALEQALDGRGEPPTALVPARCKLSPSNPDRYVQDERRTAPAVLPGQQADFRRGAVPVVLTVTDTNFLRPAGTPLKPDCTVDVERVAARYAAAGVHVVGLGVDDIDNPQRAADLLLLARTTAGMQPPGASCAPAIDPTPGGAAVCRRALDLVPTLTALARRPAEPRQLAVVASPTSPVVAELPTLPSVDVRRPEPVPLPVTYACASPGDFDVTLHVRMDDEPIARLPARVTCLPQPPPAPRLPEALVGAIPLVGLLPPPAPVPPPAPPAQAVQPQVQTQPQAQAQTQVQTGAQDQEQAAAQLAIALQDAEQDQQLSVQPMSAREVPDLVRLTTLALMTAAAAGLAVRRRVAPVQARCDRR